MAQASPSESVLRRVTLSPAETVTEAARKSIAIGVEALTRNQVEAERGEAEPLHQLRVASRRLRASIELFSGILYAAQLKIIRRDLRWIIGEAGAARECDVIAELLKSRAAKIDPELAKAIAPMLVALEARRNFEHAKLCRLLESKRYRSLIARLSRPAVKQLGARRRIGFGAHKLLKPIVRDATRRGDQLDKDAAARKFHKLRAGIKRLRYVLEMLAPLGARRHRKTLARLEELQDLLGKYNDVVVATAWLHEYAHASNVPTATVLAAGALIHSLGSYGDKLRRRGLKEWRRFERSGLLHGTLDEIRRSGKLAPVAEPLTHPPPAMQPDLAGLDAAIDQAQAAPAVQKPQSLHAVQKPQDLRDDSKWTDPESDNSHSAKDTTA